MDLRSNEQILSNVAASMPRGLAKSNGRMKITNQLIVFEPAAINLLKRSIEISLDDIADIRSYNILFLVPFGIYIQLASGEEYKFHVLRRSRLISIIRQNMKQIDTSDLQKGQPDLNNKQDSPVSFTSEEPIKNNFLMKLMMKIHLI